MKIEVALSNAYSEMSESAGKCRNVMNIDQGIDPNTLISSMAPCIHQIKARSLGTLVIIILKAVILRTAGVIPRGVFF